MDKLAELKAKFRVALTAARDIAAAAEKAQRDFTTEEREKLAGLVNEADDLKKQIKAVEGDEALRKEIGELGIGLADGDGAQQQNQFGGNLSRGKGRTIGEQFINDPSFQAWLKQVAPNGVIPAKARGLTSPPVEFRSLHQKALITGADDESAGAFVQTDYTGIYEPLGRQPLTLRDLVSIRTTESDLVEFVRQTAQVTQATPVAEANVTEYTGATGEVSGEKPEGTSTWEQVTAAVKTIAVWIPATKRALADVGQLRGLIDQELRDDLREEEEDQLINGDGTGENFTGILNTAGILTQAWDTDLLTTTRRAKTTLRVTGRARPTAWLVNPYDWETIELLQDGNNRFYWGGPLMNGQPQLWGVPVVESETIAEGTALLGDFRKAVIWDREQASVSVSDSHADFFIRNMIAVLAEERLAFGLIRPHAFIQVDMSAGS